jgi:Ser/Thr protein kinase RdoA (MazF antagonist)
MAAAEEHKRRPTQLLVGDLSPKNTYIENGVVRLCDLENAHQGAIEYDQAFALAHVLLHQKSEQDAVTAMQAFLDGYQELGPTVDRSDGLLGATLHGILLYRLDNPIIPYELPFSDDRRQQMTANVFASLDQNTQGLEEIATNLFKG